jgi:hypothetical protein
MEGKSIPFAVFRAMGVFASVFIGVHLWLN